MKFQALVIFLSCYAYSTFNAYLSSIANLKLHVRLRLFLSEYDIWTFSVFYLATKEKYGKDY